MGFILMSSLLLTPSVLTLCVPNGTHQFFVILQICKLGLKSLQLLLNANVGLDQVDVGSLLGTVRHLSQFGLPGFRYQKPAPIRPSHLQKLDMDEIVLVADSSKVGWANAMYSFFKLSSTFHKSRMKSLSRTTFYENVVVLIYIYI